MTNPTENSTEDVPSFNMWKGIVIAMLLTSVAYFASRVYLTQQVNFKVTTQQGYAGAQGHDRNLLFLKVQSTNDKPVKVLKITVNNSEQCLAREDKPVQLALGEQIQGLLLCDPIKVLITTDRGTAEYEFQE